MILGTKVSKKGGFWHVQANKNRSPRNTINRVCWGPATVSILVTPLTGGLMFNYWNNLDM